MWTKREDAELNRLWPSHSASEIAAKLGRTRNAVIGRKHRIDGTYSGRLYADDVRRKEEMAAKLKMKSEAEEAAMKKLQLDVERKMPRNVAIKRAFDGGARGRVIAEVFGISRQAVSLIVLGQNQKQVVIG